MQILFVGFYSLFHIQDNDGFAPLIVCQLLFKKNIHYVALSALFLIEKVHNPATKSPQWRTLKAKVVISIFHEQKKISIGNS